MPDWPQPDESGCVVLKVTTTGLIKLIGLWLLLVVAFAWLIKQPGDTLHPKVIGVVLGSGGVILCSYYGCKTILLAATGKLDLLLDEHHVRIKQRFYVWKDVVGFKPSSRWSNAIVCTVAGKDIFLGAGTYGMKPAELADFLSLHLSRNTGRPLAAAAQPEKNLPLWIWGVIFLLFIAFWAALPFIR